MRSRYLSKSRKVLWWQPPFVKKINLSNYSMVIAFFIIAI